MTSRGRESTTMSQTLSELDIQPDRRVAISSGANAQEADAIPGAFGAEERIATGTETILFVEDEAFVREVMSEVLRAAGYRILMARSAAEALRIYDQLSAGVDMLLTDVILPGDSGRDLAKQLKAQNARLKVLLITGYGREMGVNQKEYPAEKCLAKPLSARMLLGAIRELLDGPEFKPGDAVGPYALRR